jgi:hypothetical protein
VSPQSSALRSSMGNAAGMRIAGVRGHEPASSSSTRVPGSSLSRPATAAPAAPAPTTMTSHSLMGATIARGGRLRVVETP